MDIGKPEPSGLPADWASPRCPHCGGNTAVENPIWRAYRDRYLPARKAWEHAHPGQDWLGSEDHRALLAYHPPEHEPPELPCETCAQHGVGDLIVHGITETAEAADRAHRHLTTWRASRQTDLAAARDALDALHQAGHAASSAAEKLGAELDYAELTERLRQPGLPFAGD